MLYIKVIFWYGYFFVIIIKDSFLCMYEWIIIVKILSDESIDLLIIDCDKYCERLLVCYYY